MGQKISIELDHINGNHTDNRIENLRFLCPNCHSQTDTYRGKNVKHSEDVQNKKKCPDCGCNKRSIANKCKKCYIKELNTSNKINNYSLNKKCLDCNNIIQNESLRCKPCYNKSKKEGKHEKEKKESKLTKACPDCNKIISNKSLRCRLCNNKLIKERSNTYGKNQEKGLCIDCNKDIDYKAVRCIPCSNKIVEEANNKLSNKCIDCNKEIWNTSKRCTECYNIKTRKVNRPSYEQLLEDKKEMNFIQIGRKYNVADNTIRKWIKKYEYLRSQEYK